MLYAVGTSIYNSGYIGNHTTGGGILIKYNQDGEELMRTNYGDQIPILSTNLVITDEFLFSSRNCRYGNWFFNKI